MNPKILFSCGALFGFLGVAMGAFGAHAVKARLSPEMLTVYETAARYHMFHALALLACAWAWTSFHPGFAKTAAWCFLSGTVIFSGSLYVLALSGVKAWGAVTPFGGLLLLAGWGFLAVSALYASR